MAAHWEAWLPKWRTYSKNAITRAMNNLLDRDDISPQVSNILHPVLVTHGDSDLGMPMVLGKNLSQQLKTCQGFVVAHGAAHIANFTHPDAINPSIVEFMNKVTN